MLVLIRVYVFNVMTKKLRLKVKSSLKSETIFEQSGPVVFLTRYTFYIQTYKDTSHKWILWKNDIWVLIEIGLFACTYICVISTDKILWYTKP